MPAQYQICLVAAGNESTAQKIAQGLVEKKLAACVSIIPAMRSIYWWQGKIEKAEELLLIIKSRKNLSKDILQYVKENHSYTNPEIIFVDIESGSEEYLDWIGANTIFDANISKDSTLKKKL